PCVDKVYRRKLSAVGAQAWDVAPKPAEPRLWLRRTANRLIRRRARARPPAQYRAFSTGIVRNADRHSVRVGRPRANTPPRPALSYEQPRALRRGAKRTGVPSLVHEGAGLRSAPEFKVYLPQGVRLLAPGWAKPHGATPLTTQR